jgi:hypothetical protein
MTQAPALMTAEQAAAFIGCCVKTLGRLRRAGRIHYYNVAGRIRYSAADCVAYLDSCRVVVPPCAPEPVKGRRTARVVPIRPRFSEAHD